MGFFDDLKKEISQAVNELVSDEELLPEEGNYDADSPNAAGEQSKEEEYFDEDDYIETEEDYADNTQQNMGVVIDDFASDEYVNTLDIDIKELIASYSSELGNNMQIPNNSVNEEMQYDNTYNNMEAMNNFGFSDDTEQIYAGDDDVMVNTLDDYMPEETSAEETFAAQGYEAEEAPAEEAVSEEPVVEEAVSEEPVAEEPVSEESVIEETVSEESAAEEAVFEEPVLGEAVIEQPEEKVLEEPEEIQAEPVVEESTEEISPPPKEEVKEEPEVSVTEQAPVKEKPKKTVKKEVLPEQPVINKTIKKEVHQKTEEVDIEEPVIILKSQLKEKKEEDMKEEVLTSAENSKEGKPDSADYSDETAVITKGLAVKGDLIAEGSINVFGEVEGNITCKGKLMVSGTIYGNAEAGELFANGAHITGNIVSKGSVKIGQGTIIIGNVTGTSAVIAGAVKGDIDVKGPVIVDATAIVMGDIKSKSVQINIGAAIEGRCSQCYADVSPTAFFKEN